MELLTTSVSDGTIWSLETLMNSWVFYLALAVFAFEILRYAVKKRFSWRLAGDSATNVLTQAAYLAISFTVFYGFYGLVFYGAHQFALFEIDTAWASILVCIVLADLIYYWSHRFTHRVGIAWATHEVHHSSPNFNMSVAYRFGPTDDVWAILFDVWLVVIGFDPVVVVFATLFVLQYQTFLHTELIRKLPRPIEFIMNTPSHHRVHHGSNPEYLDKNFGGMFIVWDRLFGTFQEERAPVVYGLVEQIGTVNPVRVFLHGHVELIRKVIHTTGVGNKLKRFVMPPDWDPTTTPPTATPAPDVPRVPAA